MTTKENQTVHVPVMLTEAIDGLHLQKGMTVIDATLGGGGYTHALHQKVMPGGRVIAIDQDLSAIERFRASHECLAQSVTLVHDNYSRIGEICADLEISTPDAIVADLGISSDQLERADRGFSFLKEGPIDMRMDTEKGLPASEIINEMSEGDLVRLLLVYGDEKYALRIVQEIIAARPLVTTGDLSQVIATAYPKMPGKRRAQHPATKTFQALRIAVNEEYAHIERFVHEAISLLVSGGYLSIVSFHSGEDRIVKNILREYARNCTCPDEAPVCACSGQATVRLVSRKGQTPSEKEIAENPRSRSARLRVVQKL